MVIYRYSFANGLFIFNTLFFFVFILFLTICKIFKNALFTHIEQFSKFSMFGNFIVFFNMQESIIFMKSGLTICYFNYCGFVCRTSKTF